MLVWVLPKSDRCKKGEKLFMSARAPPSHAPPPPNEARSRMNHSLSFSLPTSWGRGSRVVLGGRVSSSCRARNVCWPWGWWISWCEACECHGSCGWGQWCWKGIPWTRCDWCAAREMLVAWSCTSGALLLPQAQEGIRVLKESRLLLEHCGRKGRRPFTRGKFLQTCPVLSLARTVWCQREPEAEPCSSKTTWFCVQCFWGEPCTTLWQFQLWLRTKSGKILRLEFFWKHLFIQTQMLLGEKKPQPKQVKK